MPGPITDQWAINLGTIAAGAVAALGAWIWKRFEQRKPEPPIPGLAVVGGGLVDNRLMENLVDQLDRNERTMRDLCNEMRRSNDALELARRALEARHKAQEAKDDELLQRIQMARAKSNRPPE